MSTKLRSTSYCERPPVTAPAASVACTWIGVVGDDGDQYVDRVLPDACVDVIWNGRGVFVAGPDTGPVVIPPSPGSFHVGVRFRPGNAPDYLGVPASALLDERVDVAEVWGRETASRLEDGLAGSSLDDAARVLEAHVATIESGTSRWTDAASSLALEHDVESMADALGVTARTLHRRCVHAFGYGPKMLQRVLRFQRFLAFAASSPGATVGQLAANAGYADQSHLTRVSNELSGLTPRALLINRGVRSVQDASD